MPHGRPLRPLRALPSLMRGLALDDVGHAGLAWDLVAFDHISRHHQHAFATGAEAVGARAGGPFGAGRRIENPNGGPATADADLAVLSSIDATANRPVSMVSPLGR